MKKQKLFQQILMKRKRKVSIFYFLHVISDLNGEETAGTFYEKELQKTNQKEFRVEKVIKRKGYDSSVNGCIDKKDIV